MFYLVSGGSGSGKSEFAENLSVKLREQNPGAFVYIATMVAFDEEARKKIERHRKMRKEKHFETVECFTGLRNLTLPKGCTVLLDCMSNLAANEMFQDNGAREETVEQIVKGVNHVVRQCQNLVIVTNEIFSDGCTYDEMTMLYIENLGKINGQLAAMADGVVEVVCGIPVYHKGNELE